MKNEFVPYDIALAMKELGFKKKCFKFYWADEVLYAGVGEFKNKETDLSDEKVSAPLYQQAFRWFREEHELEACVSCFYNDKLDIPYEKRKYHAFIIRKGITSKNKYKTYEEAELACLRKIIEIVKEKQDGHN